MNFSNRWRSENSGPFAITMPRRIACSYTASASLPGGSSIHSTKPPAGRVTRVFSGKCVSTARVISSRRRAYTGRTVRR